MYKTFNNVLQINWSDMAHEDYYRKIIEHLGVDEVRTCIPFDLKTLIEAYKEDERLNNLSIKKWDFAAGFIPHKQDAADVLHIGSKLTKLYNKIGVTCYSCSDGVCILKQAAKDMVQEHLTLQNEEDNEYA